MNLLDKGPFRFLTRFITNGHERSVKAKKNIVSSVIIKGLSIGISFISLPITLNYVDTATYGVWLTLSSVVAWFAFFDIGLTQGFRNRFAEALAIGNNELARIYVSTTYALLGCIFSIVWIAFLVANQFLNWSSILNVSENLRPEITKLAVIVFTYFCFSFIFKIVTTVLLADQQPAKSSLIDLIGQAIALIIIVVLTKTTEGSLVKLGIALCASPLLALIVANVILFGGKYKKFSPAVSYVRFSHARHLFNLGMVFFVIQLAAIIQYQTANVIIARNFGATEVTGYNIVYRYFGIPYMFFIIFLTPFWSASTEAFQRNDLQWIRNGMKRYTQLHLITTLGCFLMLAFAGPFYRLWLGEGKVTIPFALSLWGCVYYIVMMYGAKYVYFLNGISALRIQFISSVISPFLYIAAVMIMIKWFNAGVHSLFISSVIANFNGFILAPLQYYMIMRKGRQGIWVK